MRRIFDLETTPITDGVTVVEASAGTGKTYCLTGLVLRLLLEGKVRDVSSVLVVTFTQAATHELTTRVRGALRLAYRLMRGEASSDDPFFRGLVERFRGADGEAVLRRALLCFDDLGIFTIHGFCKRVLDESAFETGVDFRPEFLDDDTPFLLQAARDFWRRRLYPVEDLVTAVVSHERWTPETFLDAYRTWRRHPRTRLEPRPAAFETAVEGLRAACEDLGGAWNRSAVRTLLASLRYRKYSKIDPARLEPLLDDLEAFHAGSPARGLYAVSLLSGEKLRGAVLKSHHGALEGHPYVRGCDRVRDAIDAFAHSLRGAFVTEVDEIFSEAKEASGTLSFDDLLRRVDGALRDSRRAPRLLAQVRDRYQAALIDEFQDTDLTQYEIFHRLFQRGPLYLIGDPKQAIYRFRGADVFAYMAAKAGADRRLTLDRNWRSDERLLAAVDALFRHAPRPFVFPEIPFEQIDAAEVAGRERLGGDGLAPLQWLWLPKEGNKDRATRQIARAVGREVASFLNGGASLRGPSGERAVEPGDIAILVRTNEQAQGVREALREVRVPAVVSRAGDVFESEELAELLRVLEAVDDPSSSFRVRAAWSTRLWGDDSATLLRVNDDDDAWQARFEHLGEYRRLWHRQGFMPMIRRLLRDREIRRRFLAGPSGERRLTNLLHAAELLHQAVLERHLSPAALLVWTAQERARALEQARGRVTGTPGAGRAHDSDAAELRLESDAQAVQIATVHKSKGLEYGVVFCPFLWESRPESKPPVAAHLDPRHVVYDFGSEDFPRHRDQAEAERLAEDLRLAYVAMTRARHRCYLVWGEIGRASASSPLAYLLRTAAAGEREEPPEEGILERSSMSEPLRGQLGLASLFDPPTPPGEHVRRALENARAESAGWRLALQAFADHHRDLMEVRVIDEDENEVVWEGPPTPPRTLTVPSLPDFGDRLTPWQMSSFSSLSRGHEAELPDYFDSEVPVLRSEASDTGAEPEGMFLFARGTRAGTCLHEILELCDLGDLAGEGTRSLVDEALERHGLADPGRHGAAAAVSRFFDPAAAVLEMLRRVAAAAIPSAGFSLAAVAPASRLAEWQFTTPLRGVDSGDFAGIFRELAEGRVRDEYAADVARLDNRAARGFLTGIVDLVFERAGRWWVLDWKSNHLGDTAAEYGSESLWEAMRHHHYVLQYHLYMLALQRFLRSRLPDYDYDRHIGGVIYVFLRGVTGSPGSDGEPTGWYVDRPPARLIDDLEDALLATAKARA